MVPSQYWHDRGFPPGFRPAYAGYTRLDGAPKTRQSQTQAEPRMQPDDGVEEVERTAPFRATLKPESSSSALWKAARLIAQLLTAGGIITLCVELQVFSHIASPFSEARQGSGLVPLMRCTNDPPAQSSCLLISQTPSSTTKASSTPSSTTRTSSANPLPTSDLLIGRDCGIFTMTCAGAEGACNNACYAVNCVNPAWSTLRYMGRRFGPRPSLYSNEDIRNRGHSGQKIPGLGAICGIPPFSQKLRDPMVRENGDLFDTQYDTDEWPMASTIQDDFKFGQIRNTLRCMPRPENGHAGTQWGRFIESSGYHPGKTCPGRLGRGDFARVAFDLTNANLDKVPYCLPDTDCINDGYQFHLTALLPPNHMGGRMSNPYNNFTNNKYQITRLAVDTWDNEYAADIQQCSLHIHLTETLFTAQVYDVNQNVQGQHISEPLDVTGETTMIREVTGLHYPVQIKIQKSPRRPFEEEGSDIEFRYASPSGPSLRAFEWKLDTVGYARPSDGGILRYCQQVEDFGKGKGSWKCTFPC